MSKMKTWWLIGYQRWGGLKPAAMWFPDGRCFRPLLLGVWIRDPYADTGYNVMAREYVDGTWILIAIMMLFVCAALVMLLGGMR